MLLSLIDSNSTSALTYSDNINMQFTFNPSLSIDVSGDLTIDNLTPGNYSDSNIITITTSTNNVTGYTLYADVGNSTYNYTDLKNGTNTFTNLSTNKSSLSNFDANSNTWGYSYSVDNGTNWISGDYDNYATGYNGLPIYSSANGIKLADTDTNTSSTLKFKIGARSTNTQAAGEYTNIINFYATAHNTPTTFYEAFASAGKTAHNGYYKMQDMATAICSAVELEGDDSAIDLIDIRDNEIYKIAKLKDHNCWMLDNLALGSTSPITLSSADTNIASGATFVLPASIGTNFNTYTDANINSSYKEQVITHYGASDGKVGVYYNYCAATAGTYCYAEDSGTGNANYDVCSRGWRMPTGGDSGEYHSLYASYGNDNTQFRNSLSISLSGSFINSAQLWLDERGDYWSSTYNANARIYILFVSAPDTVDPANYRAGAVLRNTGNTIRCLAK